MYYIDLFAEIKQAAGYLSPVQLAVVLIGNRTKVIARCVLPDTKYKQVLIMFVCNATPSRETHDRDDDDDPRIILVSLFLLHNSLNFMWLLKRKIIGF